MKGLLLLQRRFAILGHAVALALKEKYGVNNFCGYVYLRYGFDFLKSQSDIKYSALLLDDELHKRYRKEKVDPEYLAYLEKEFGIPNLWLYLTVDRIVMSNQLVREYPYDLPPYTHEEMLRILQVKARAILKMFDEEKPDFVLVSVIGAIGGMLIYHIAKKRNIPVWVLDVARIGDFLTLNEHYAYHTEIDRAFDQLQAEKRSSLNAKQARKFLADFQKTPKIFQNSIYLRPGGEELKNRINFLWPQNFFSYLGWFLKTTKSYFLNAHRDDYQEIKPWFYLWDGLKRKMRLLWGVLRSL